MSQIGKYTVGKEEVWVALDDNGNNEYFTIPLVPNDGVDALISKDDVKLKVINPNRLTPKDLREIVGHFGTELFRTYDSWNDEALRLEEKIEGYKLSQLTTERLASREP